ncbi:hypothetical protein LLEC1_01892 [Akanthomyces lecanii]|uniref:Uncharacterized protein n=1 Tax=Cordyceps confragosa TaxID=2714763 RepID=A0A179I8A0_CORDF|nr:hypothetical protein LLEC1_01892 [Akanthomyces lecanii]
MSESDEEGLAPHSPVRQPPLRGFAAKMADYAAKRAALGRTPSPTPQPRVLVLISGRDGIVASAERLQELAELPESPQVFEVPFAEPSGNRRQGPASEDAIETVCISDVALSALAKLKRKTHIGRYGGWRCVWYEGGWFNVDVVLGAKRVLIS